MQMRLNRVSRLCECVAGVYIDTYTQGQKAVTWTRKMSILANIGDQTWNR